jgi:SAM-dependent methyltransferase
VGAAPPRDEESSLKSGPAAAYLSSHPTLRHGGGGSKGLWIADLLAPVLPAAKEARILEIGPGHGEALSHLIHQCGYRHVEAIDNSPEVIEACRSIEGVTPILADVTTFLRARPAEYDLILLYHVLEHFSRDAVPVVVDAIRHALRSGGVAVIGVPNAAAPIIGADQQYFDFTHQTAFSPWSLEQVLRIAGFQRVEVRPVWPPRAGLARAVQRMLQRSVLAVMRAYLWIFSGVPRPVLTHSIVAYAWK